MNPSLLPDEKLRLRGEKKGLMDLVQKVVCAENGVSLTLCGCVIDTRRNALASKKEASSLGRYIHLSCASVFQKILRTERGSEKMHFLKRKEKDFLFQGHDEDEIMRRDVSPMEWLPNCTFLEFK